MSSKVGAKHETRSALIETGMDIMLVKGYTNTGIQEILSVLAIPKGSFYHHFESKENFAIEIIRHYDEFQTTALIQILRDTSRSPLERLRLYCDTYRTKLNAQECKRGCLIGNLSQEMSDQSEILRQELSTVIRKWRDMFAECIAEGQKTGEIKSTRSADSLAEIFQSGWAGAVMRAKTLRDTESIDNFVSVMFDDILKA
ncbi:MAG: TetR family transcriptional regulator C-terminal domain-containing protein [Candidatus Melainabacteria bacterium]|nr:TetR family transcriptional regulator C-terminal domain-containing protein [Candidatus Melainabacteria bacterium]